MKTSKLKKFVELVWQDEQLFAGHVTRTWKGPDPRTGKPVSKTISSILEMTREQEHGFRRR